MNVEAKKTSPLADRMRPETLDNFLGQDEIVGREKLLRRAITGDYIPSMIFWGPPGSGKTTLAHIIAKQTKSDFLQFSAVTSGLKDLKEVKKKARENAMGVPRIAGRISGAWAKIIENANPSMSAWTVAS